MADFDPRAVVNVDFFGVLNEEFPRPADQLKGIGPGGILVIRLQPDKPPDGEHGIEFELNWQSERYHPLNWIARPNDWSKARVEEDLLVLEYSSGARFSLSRESGWPVEMSHPAGAHLELIEYKNSADAGDYEIPSPTKGMKNIAQELIEAAVPLFLFGQRSCVYTAAAHACREKTFEKAVIDEKLIRVFAALYTKELRRCFGDTVEDFGKRIAGFADWCEQRLNEIGDDSKLRDEFDAIVSKRRADLVKHMEDGINEFVTAIPAFERSTTE